MDYVALMAFVSPNMMSTDAGRSTSGSYASGSPVMGKNGYTDPESHGFWLEELNSVFRQGGAPDLVTPVTDISYQMGSPDTAFEVSWGAWNGQATPFDKQNDLINPGNVSPENKDMYWITLMPTPIDPMTMTPGGRTGVLTYSNPVAIIGNTTAGMIDQATFNFNVNIDFDTASITSGSMSFAESTISPLDSWSASGFSGTLNGTTLLITPMAIQYHGSAATGQINAVLTGPTAEGIGGGFDFDYMSGTAATEGVFLINCVGDTNC